MGVNKKSLKNLNPGKRITWNGLEFKSFLEMSRKTGFPHSTILDRYHRDDPVEGHYIDELL
jgi:hypothetical protein